ncbi:MAG: hypothetical protein DMG05_17980, partial [Acidobacteria bacterium]
MNIRRLRSYLFLFRLYLLTSLSAPVLYAQVGSTELTGEVRDQTRLVIAGATVALTNAQTNQRYGSRTKTGGVYAFTHLKPRVYTLTIEAPGFKRFRQDGLRLATGERVRLDVELVIGDVSETLLVTGETPLLRTETGSLGQVIGNRTILDLPLNGRNFVPLVALSSGVALPPGSSFPRINGGRPRVNEYLYDGISVLQPEPGQVAFFPIIDSIQEFKVEANSPSAEFGRFNGGVINLTTKSGTNELHGSVFEFLRNEALNSRNLFAAATSANPKKPLFRRSQFGFVLGGPLIKDKTFFFADYQGTRQDIGRVRISTVPTLLQR